jgi:hypothetical protein
MCIGAAGTAGLTSVQDRYSQSRIDAFMDGQLMPHDGPSHRRMKHSDPEYGRKLQAEKILEAGADAILMEYEEGFVPRQGTQRVRDD